MFMVGGGYKSTRFSAWVTIEGHNEHAMRKTVDLSSTFTLYFLNKQAMKSTLQNKTRFFGSLLFAGLITFSACKKDPVDPGTGLLEFHLHNYLDKNEVVDYNTIYTTDTGRKISLSLAQLYLSHIQLVKADGSTYEVTGQKILKVQEEDVYSLGEIPAGDYKSIRFRVGFDATDNQLTPAANATLNHAEMWFGNAFQPSAGYVFLHVQGMIDPTPNAMGTIAEMQPFEYKLGTTTNYVQVSLPEKTLTVARDRVNIIHLLADYAALFNGIDLAQPGNLSVLTAADNAIMPGTWITLNLADIFRYEGE